MINQIPFQRVRRYISTLLVFVVTLFSGGFGTIPNSASASTSATWDRHLSGTNDDLYGVAYGNHKWWTAGNFGGNTNFYWSTNPSSWEPQDLSQSITHPANPNDAVYTGDQWVVVGNFLGLETAPNNSPAIYTSPDGSEWNLRNIPGNGYLKQLFSVAADGDTIVAVGANNYATSLLVTSTDGGVSWTDYSSEIFENTALWGVTYADGKFVLVGDGGVIYTSSNGQDWSSQGSGSDSLSKVTYGNGKYVAVGANITLTSENGQDWAPHNVPFVLYSVAYGGGEFVAVGEGGTIVSSTDGITWNVDGSNTSSSLFDVEYGNGKFVAVGEGGTIVSRPPSVTLSNNANLDNLVLKEATLNELFDSNTLNYTSRVLHDVESVSVTPTLADSNASVTVEGVSATSGVSSGPIHLGVGHNDIEVVVTAQDGITQKTYTIDITKAVAPTPTLTTPHDEDFNDEPTGLGVVAPQVIDDWTFSMVSTIGGTPRTQIKLLAPNTTNGLLFLGNYQQGAMEYGRVQSNTGAFKLDSFKVIERNSTTDHYTVQGYLGGLPVTGATLTFTPVTGSFFTVDFTINPAWQNIDEFRITAGTTIKLEIDDIDVSDPVTTTASSDAKLNQLLLSEGLLSPSFHSEGTSYHADVANSVTSLTVTPITSHASASVQLRVNNGSWQFANSGSASASLDLNVGSNPIDVKVTAEDGVTTKTYTVDVDRAEPIGSDNPSVTVEIGGVSGVPGENVLVPVSITQASAGVGSYGIKIDFDETAIEVVSVTDPLDDPGFASNYDHTEGWLFAAWADMTGGDLPKNVDDTLFTIVFKIKEGATVGDKGLTIVDPSDITQFSLTDVNVTEMDKTLTTGKVTVNPATHAATPTIDMQPQGTTVNVGDAATLSVAASGGTSLSYQWYSNTTNSTVGGTPIIGATSATYAVPTGTAGTTYYYVVVTNTDSSATGNQTATVTSNIVAVTVNALTHAEAPTINTQPQGTTVNVGDVATLSVAASGGASLSYQWYSNTTNSTVGGTAIIGATNATYAAPTGTVGTAYYYVVVTNTDSSATGNQTATVTSNIVAVTVNALTHAEAPTINTQPQGTTVNVGDAAILSIDASGEALSYQWYSNTTNSTVGGTAIIGATNATYAVPTGTVGTAYYYVVVTNTDSSATGNQTATVTSNIVAVSVNALTNAVVPTLITQPQGTTVNVGDAAILSIDASGEALSYQWYSNTTNSTVGATAIIGATSATYAVPTGTAGSTYYYVVVTNTDSTATGNQTATVTSNIVAVSVNALTNAAVPTLITQPQGTTVNVGEAAILSIDASGEALSYQWYSNTTNSTVGGTPIIGATSATYAVPTGTAGSTYYYVVVTNTDSSATGNQTATVTSNIVAVTVNAITHAAVPTLITQPQGTTVNVGDAAILSIDASGEALSYQWYSNTTNSTVGGTPIIGATSSTYAVPTGTVGTTYYYVVVTNTDSSATGNQTATATSNIVAVTVNALTHAETPTINTQPQGTTVNVGDAAALSVAASGGASLSYQWYSNTTNSTVGGTPIIGATSATYAVPTGTAGSTYYYVVVTNTDSSATGNQIAIVTSNIVAVTVNELTHAEAPILDVQPQDATVKVGDSTTLSVTASGGASLSYQWYSNTTNSTDGGTAITGATSASYAVPTGTAGTTYYYAVVTNTDSSATGQKIVSITSRAALVTVKKRSSGGNGGGNSTPSNTSGSSTAFDVMVNGKAENAGTATTTKINNQTVTTVAVDQKKIEDKLHAEGQHAVVTVPVNQKSDVIVGELNGQMVKMMEKKQAVLEIKTDEAVYTISAEQINIDKISDQVGHSVALKDIKVQIDIAKPTGDMVKVVENAAEKGTFTLVAPPVSFTMRGTYGDTSINVSKFDAYVERTIAIPEGVDPSKITTGVVVEPDGTVRHVPTKIVVIEGKYYAKINSLTNSTYSVVWHPLEFTDVANHWAKNAVNDMGSRMVISGVGNGKFNPDQDITRAEFAAIMARALGLKLEEGSAGFKDVQESDWYSSAVKTAFDYHLINGFEDGTFRPADKITREQAMTMIAKAMEITDLKSKLPAISTEQTLGSFTDAKEASTWAQSSIATSLQADIVTGRSSNGLAPKAYISRAEVAVMMQRLLQKSGLI